MASDEGYLGGQNFASAASDRNALDFIVRMLLGQLATATVVKVVKVTPGNDALALAGTVDVTPLVAQIDGKGNTTPHGTIYALPYMRAQGGTNAIILDPKAGDLGICVFASRDISSVKATKAAAPPGSRRQFDMADGMYLGGILNGVPNQYIRFSSTGIAVVSPTQILFSAPDIQMHGPVTGNSTAAFSGDVTAAGTSVHTHHHGGVTTGGGNTGLPI